MLGSAELGEADMGWFKRRPSWEVQYAQNIYDALVARNSIDDITATVLRIPTAHAYQNKILLQREFIFICGLGANCQPREWTTAGLAGVRKPAHA